jgi:hypothetical protein
MARQNDMGCLGSILFGLLLLMFALSLVATGIHWLLTSGLPLTIAAVVLIIASSIFRAWLRHKQVQELVSSLESRVRQVKAVEKRATRAVQRIVADRPAVESSRRKLEQLRQTMRSEVHFHALTQEHNTSRVAADLWHSHMHEAIGSRQDFSGEIGSFGQYVAELEALGRRAKRGRPAAVLQSARQTVAHLRQMSSTLQTEISRSRSSLDSHNNQTRLLKEHIRDTCGGRGRHWYQELEQRTAMRKAQRKATSRPAGRNQRSHTR